MSHEEHQSCIDACIRCAQECEHCADACLSERDVAKMAACIRLDKDCAEICWSVAAFLSRSSLFAQEMCRVCADICDACGQECRKHKMDHCQKCADECERCAEECRQMAHVAA
jgi:hypothetical protein